MNSRDYLSFTRKERIGVLALVVILFAVAVVPGFFRDKKVELTDAGLPAAEDSPAVQPPPTTAIAGHLSRPRISRQPKRFNVYQAKRKVIEINSADTSDFIALPGIGSKLAARIVLFRDKLGGFYSVGQIAEVYGLKDSVFRLIEPQLRCNSTLIKKIDVNEASREMLQVHPYIRWNLADALLAYRLQHGPFSSREDIGKIDRIDSVALQKMLPYLSFSKMSG